MNNSIYIRRKNKIYLEKGEGNLENDYIFNFLKNLESLGYTFSETLADVLKTLSIEKLKTFYKQLIADLKENLGAHVEYHPMYPNFPEQVKEAIMKSVTPLTQMVKLPGSKTDTISFSKLSVTGGTVNLDKALQYASTMKGKKKQAEIKA